MVQGNYIPDVVQWIKNATLEKSVQSGLGNVKEYFWCAPVQKLQYQ